MKLNTSFVASVICPDKMYIVNFFSLYFLRFILCVSVFWFHECLGTWCPQKSEKGVEYPDTWTTDSCKQLCGYWELNLGPVKDSALNHWNISLVSDSTPPSFLKIISTLFFFFSGMEKTHCLMYSRLASNFLHGGSWISDPLASISFYLFWFCKQGFSV